MDEYLLMTKFCESFHKIESIVNERSNREGWDFNSENLESVASKLALMHSEISEALESLREGDPVSDKIPEFTGMEEEFADLIMRLMHISHKRNLRVPEAIFAKLNYNLTRPHKHGKLF